MENKKLKSWALRIEAAAIDETTPPHEVWHLVSQMEQMHKEFGLEEVAEYIDMEVCKTVLSKLFTNLENYLNEK